MKEGKDFLSKIVKRILPVIENILATNPKDNSTGTLPNG